MGDEISRDAIYVLCNQVLPNNPRYLPNFLDTVMLITLRVKAKILVFFKRMLEKIISCRSFMVKR